MRKIIKLFEKGNVCVFGFTGSGKDTLFGNVIMRRKLPYVCDISYGGQWIPYNYNDFDCGGNTYVNFVEGNYKYFKFKHPDHTDLYLPDGGIKYPSTYSSELDRKYPQMPTFFALNRHVCQGHTHWNVQAPERMWNKAREMGDTYIMCCWIKWFFGKYCFQKIRIYEKYQSAVDRVPPFPLPRPWFSVERRFQWKMLKTNYLISHGVIKERFLFYRNRSKHNTRAFRELMLNGKKSY